MSRHGDCAEVATLKRRIPDLGGVNNPHAFATFMRQKGYEVTSAPVAASKGRAVEVSVPGKDLYLMFVTQEICTAIVVR